MSHFESGSYSPFDFTNVLNALRCNSATFMKKELRRNLWKLKSLFNKNLIHEIWCKYKILRHYT